jgi:hypothetical protein
MEASLAKREALFKKYPIHKRGGGMAQVVEFLSSNCEALSSNPSTGWVSMPHATWEAEIRQEDCSSRPA